MASSQSSSIRSLIAVCQMTATHDPEENFQTAFSMMHRAKERDAKVINVYICLYLAIDS